MNICFLCKYPPIQGGVSAYAYWAARGLAQRGHQVIVVTNADEVEPAFRMHLSASDRGPNGAYAPTFAKAGGSVQVYSTEKPDPEELYYIPMGNPTITRLATMTADLVRKFGCEVIYANYLEPYGVAAHLASLWTGVPYIIQHAGSDLGRLMPRPDLKTAYFEVLSAADRILSREPSRSKLIEYGILEERISSTAEFSPPFEFFHPQGNASPMDIDKALLLAQSSSADAQDGRYAPLNPQWPVLGVYGKIGEYKGSYDLLLAMAKVVDSGLPFHLVALSQEEHVRLAAKRLGLSAYVRALPFVPPWQIPSFIWRCDAIAFLERDFPISAHAPVVPLEVVRCGKCLIVSSEVALKQPFRHHIRHKKNAVVVADPKDHMDLASQITFALQSIKRTEEIGRQAAITLGALGTERHDAYIDKIHALFAEVASEKPAKPTVSAANKAARTRTYLEASATLFPLVSKILSEPNKVRLREILCDHSNTTNTTAAIGHKLMEILQEESTLNGGRSPALELCRYECKLHAWADNASPSLNKAQPMTFSPQDLALLHPALTREWEIAAFEYDIDAISEAIESKEEVLDFKPEPVWILFHRGGIPARVNALTARLIALLGQSKTNIAGVFNTLAESLSIVEEAPKARLIEGAASALEGLYWAGILRFEPMPLAKEQT